MQGRHAIAVVNKSDLPPKIDIQYIHEFIKQIVTISAKQEDGLAELSRVIAAVSYTHLFCLAAGFGSAGKFQEIVQPLSLIHIFAFNVHLDDILTIKIHERHLFFLLGLTKRVGFYFPSGFFFCLSFFFASISETRTYFSGQVSAIRSSRRFACPSLISLHGSWMVVSSSIRKKKDRSRCV